MLIVPAIDLQNGTCVRLKQGQFNQVTQFSDSPVERAAYFAKSGAKRLHVVDLDGAKIGKMQQLPLISSMQNTGITVQAGGGIRSLNEARQCIDAGISRLVIGSLALSDIKLTTRIIETLNTENIILALDIRMNNTVPVPAINGWQTNSTSTLWEVISLYQPMGITQVLCTDIACDGMMGGPNFELYQEATDKFPDIAWQASGGIRHQEDIARLESIGVSAAILGLTLYQDNFDLVELLEEYNS